MNEPVDKFDILLVIIMITTFAIGITISVVPKLKAILEKLDVIEQKIQPNEVVLPEMSGKKDQEYQKNVQQNYQVEGGQ